MHYSQHAQSLKAAEHPAPDRVDLIGREVKLIDGRRPFKRPIFNLRDLVVAEVTVKEVHLYLDNDCWKVKWKSKIKVQLTFS